MSLFVKALPPGPKTYIRVGGGHLVTVTNTCSAFRYSSTLTDEGVYSLVVQSTEKKEKESRPLFELDMPCSISLTRS